VAEHDQQIIGLRLFLNWRWIAGGKELKAVRAVDTITHPDWQGRGIFTRLTSTLLVDMEKLGVSFVFNTPNTSSKPGYLKMGWKEVTRIPLWIRPLKPLSAALHFFRKTSRTPDTTSKLEFNNIERLDEHLQSLSQGNRLHTPRTVEYLRWRFAQVPGISYDARWQTHGDAFGLIIFRQRIRKGLRELSISELLLSESKTGIQLGSSLLDNVARESNADYMIATAAKNTPEQSALKDAGFYPLPYMGPSFTVKPLQQLENDILDWQSWRCSIGDLEVF
jgi:GNAT superfamily N-acetyltransferase